MPPSKFKYPQPADAPVPTGWETDIDKDNGFVWHTTGSGKTLTFFKASTLLEENDHIHECSFVVDRKDLDHQTRDEFFHRRQLFGFTGIPVFKTNATSQKIEDCHPASCIGRCLSNHGTQFKNPEYFYEPN